MFRLSVSLLTLPLLGCGARSTVLDDGPTGGRDGGISQGDGTSQGDGAVSTDGRAPLPDAPTADAHAQVDACTEATPCTVTLASGQFSPNSIAVDSTTLYWTNAGSGAFGSVAEVPLTGGSVTTLAPGRTGPGDVAVDATSVYWEEGGQTILRVPKGGGAPATLFAGVTDGRPDGVAGLRLDSETLYWANSGGKLVHMPKAGGAAVSLEVWEAPDAIGALAIQQGELYFEDDERIERLPVDGGPSDVVPIAPVGLGDVGPIVASATTLGWGLSTGGASLVLVPIAGGTESTVATAPYLSGFGGMALDASYVYWTSSGSGEPNTADGAVLKRSLAGGSTITLADAQTAPGAILVDGTSVCWTTPTAILRRTPE